MEDNRRFSWTDLFIKIILVIIFILFTVWLLSLSNKGISNSLNVLTDDIFAENMERMKEVGKEYFTTERLPEKVGDIEVLKLQKMYDKKLILELKDKFGNACSAENSYVSVEKYENEYQMKVYLECGEESDYIIVIMGCYDYCDTDICEKKDNTENKQIEYEYKKTTGGKWTNYGNWSEWSKVSVTKTNYREVETKTAEEEYSYDKTVMKNEYVSFEVSCPAGYKKTDDGTKCYKNGTKTVYADPNTCPNTNGDYALVSQNGFTCNYRKNSTTTVSPNTCPNTNGDYTLVSQNGFTCNYRKNSTTTVSPNTCPSKNGDYTLVSQNGFTCNYSKSSTTTVSPNACPSKYLVYSLDSQNGLTCNYSVVYKEWAGTKLVSSCSGCAAEWIDVYVTKTSYATTTTSCPAGSTQSGNICVKPTTLTKTTTVGCPAGTSPSGNSCVKSTTLNKTTTVGCPAGASQSGNSCVKSTTLTKTTTVGCPAGASQSGNSCVKSTSLNKTTTVGCPINYKKTSDGTKCYKNNSILTYDELIKTCPLEYKKTNDGTKCYKEVPSIEKVIGTKNVTYYRYRVREYVDGTTDYKWSTSKNDEKLLSAGYKLTGRTR